MDLVAQEIADRVGDLLAAAIGDRDREREGVIASGRLLSFPKYGSVEGGRRSRRPTALTRTW
jgi:hypothetical protein